MLLGTARHLAETKNFDGTVHLFQPAEVLRCPRHDHDGLFEKFCDEVCGLHTRPI